MSSDIAALPLAGSIAYGVKGARGERGDEEVIKVLMRIRVYCSGIKRKTRAGVS